jgi:hypothetical protein
MSDLKAQAAQELQRALECARAAADDQAREHAVAATVLAVRAVLSDRGIAARAELEPALLLALLSETGLTLPDAAARLIAGGARLTRDETMTAASAAVAWCAAAISPV